MQAEEQQHKAIIGCETALAVLQSNVKELSGLMKEHDQRSRVDHDRVTKLETVVDDVKADVAELRAGVNLRTWGLGSVALILTAVAGFLGLRQ